MKYDAVSYSMKKVRLVDTFAGIGGFHLGVDMACEELGLTLECVKAVEYDKRAADTYRENFLMDALGDMTKIPAKDFPDHDILTGGFPCQPFSRNGRIYNFSRRDDGKTLSEDDRSQLCFRLFDILKEKQPTCFIFENVKELLTIKNEDGSLFVDTVKANIDDCGYEVQIGIVDSCMFGLPQQRRRAYMMGWKKGTFPMKYTPEIPAGKMTEKCVRDILLEKVDDKYLLSSLWANRYVGKEENDIPATVAGLRKKEIKTKYARDLEDFWLSVSRRDITRFEALTIAYRSGEWEKPEGKIPYIWPVAIIYGDTPSMLPRQQDKLYSPLGISPTIATFSTPSFEVSKDPASWRTLAPRECMRLQGFPDTFIIHKKDAVAYKQAGNAVSVNAVNAVAQELLGALF